MRTMRTADGRRVARGTALPHFGLRPVVERLENERTGRGVQPVRQRIDRSAGRAGEGAGGGAAPAGGVPVITVLQRASVRDLTMTGLGNGGPLGIAMGACRVRVRCGALPEMNGYPSPATPWPVRSIYMAFGANATPTKTKRQYRCRAND